jgi:predicted acetyltransferase
MTGSEIVSLDVAGPEHAELLGNLLELYIHDLSAVFPNVELGPDGRFGYPKLPLYWSQPDRRFAFLIRRAERIAGFVLATRGSPAAEDPEVLDIAEFFVLRSDRGYGIGQQAATLLWERMPGKWTVRVSTRNEGAASFWRRTVAQFTRGLATECERPGEPNAWRVFSFESSPRAVVVER